MSVARIEHVNVTVSDPERAARLMETLFGWQIRWAGPARNGGRAIHIGSDDHYVALYAERDPAPTSYDFAQGHPLNHIGVAVDDLNAVEAQVVAAGLVPRYHGVYEPGPRHFYFSDPDGIEYEVVSYKQD